MITVGRIIIAAVCIRYGVSARAADNAPVTLAEDERMFTLANGIIAARIEKRSGNVVSLKYRDLELLGRGGGYWSFVGSADRFGSRRTATIRTNSDERAEVSCKFTYDGRSESLPVDVDLRYALGRGDSGLYAYAIWEHRPEYSAFSVGEARYAMKLNPAVFDFLTVDANRRRVMPTGYDWDHGTRLNLAEVRRLTTGRYAGQVEHKYDYAAVLADTPAYGWSSTQHHIGLWMINPSLEYLAGGPTKVELTGHLDTGPGGLPTLLNMWHGSHYGGCELRIGEHGSWTKLIGPFLLYCNAGENPELMWRDALTQSKMQQRAWPFDWVTDQAYPLAAQRGAVTGQIIVSDPQAPSATASNAWVGLTAPTDWQRDGEHYQYWSRADASGRFTIVNARPGTYTLRAFADGVLGEVSLTNVSVAAGQTNRIVATWSPVRFGRQVWEIGIPNRSAAEFRHGDHYWQWGLYLLYPKDFPNDVNFVIGKSDYRRDWNYCQPPRIDARGRTESTTWLITFEMAEVPRGMATLRIAICGSREGGRVWVSVNDRSVGDTGPLPNSGVMHRDGIRGYWLEKDFPFDATLLKPGPNVIKLKSRGDNWTQGVLYDYLRLEVTE